LLSQSALSVAQAMRNGSSEISARLQTLQTMNLQGMSSFQRLLKFSYKANLKNMVATCHDLYKIKKYGFYIKVAKIAGLWSRNFFKFLLNGIEVGVGVGILKMSGVGFGVRYNL